MHCPSTVRGGIECLRTCPSQVQAGSLKENFVWMQMPCSTSILEDILSSCTNSLLSKACYLVGMGLLDFTVHGLGKEVSELLHWEGAHGCSRYRVIIRVGLLTTNIACAGSPTTLIHPKEGNVSHVQLQHWWELPPTSIPCIRTTTYEQQSQALYTRDWHSLGP